MENIAHTLAGICIAKTGFDQRLGSKTALWVGAAAANIADLDILLWPLVGNETYILQHRGVTHSLLALAVAPPLIAAVSAKITKRAGQFRDLWLLAFFAYASHLAMDLPTSWGTMLLSPFDNTRFAADWVFIVDLMFWVILTLPLWVSRFLPIAKARCNLIALSFLGTYIGFCGVMNGVAVGEVAEACRHRGVTPESVAAFPAGPLPIVWNGVARDRDFLYQGRMVLGDGETGPLHRIQPRNLKHPAVQHVANTETGKHFLESWARAPYAEVRCIGDTRFVVLGDFRFESIWFNGPGFQLVHKLEKDPAKGTYHVVERSWGTVLNPADIPIADCPDLRARATP